MTTAKAISTLRERIGDSQREFAGKLGTATETVSRWENGRRAPGEETLRKLAVLAESAGQLHLRDIFESQRRAGIIARVESLPSAGTQRRVSLDDLKRWQGALQHTREHLHLARKIYTDILCKLPVEPSDQQQIGAAYRILLGLADNLLPHISNEIEPYINAPQRKAKTNVKSK